MTRATREIHVHMIIPDERAMVFAQEWESNGFQVEHLRRARGVLQIICVCLVGSTRMSIKQLNERVRVYKTALALQ